MVIIGNLTLFAMKEELELKVLDIEVQMEKAGKIDSNKAKKDMTCYKTGYNKELKHINKFEK